MLICAPALNSPQTGVIQQIKTKNSRGILHSQLREIVMQPRRGVKSLRAFANFFRGRTGRHQDQVRRVSVPQRSAVKFGEERGEQHLQVFREKRIGLHPLDEDAVRRQPRVNGGVKFPA